MNEIFFCNFYGHGLGYIICTSFIFLFISSVKFTFTLSISIFNCSIEVAPIMTDVKKFLNFTEFLLTFEQNPN